MIGLLLALGLFAPHWPDRDILVFRAALSGVDTLAVLAIAWEESGDNVNAHLRGHHCWWSMTLSDSTLVIHHEPDCEVGRFQIKPSTGRSRCPGLNIWTYDGNVTCFLKMFSEDVTKLGKLKAIKRHNGSGEQADDYVKRVLSTVGWLIERDST